MCDDKLAKSDDKLESCACGVELPESEPPAAPPLAFVLTLVDRLSSAIASVASVSRPSAAVSSSSFKETLALACLGYRNPNRFACFGPDDTALIFVLEVVGLRRLGAGLDVTGFPLPVRFTEVEDSVFFLGLAYSNGVSDTSN